MSASDKNTQFKDSPIGLIPKDWHLTNLAEFAELITSGSRGWASYYSDQGSLFIRIGNLTREHINLRFDDFQYVNPPKGTEGERTKVKANDLLISITADLGIVGMIPTKFSDAYVNQHIALIRFKPEVHYPRWIGHLTSSPCYQKVFQSLNDSGAKAGMNLNAIGALPVVLPSSEAEQKYVVETIDALDATIEKSEALIAKLKQVRAGMLHDLLTCGVDENGEIRDLILHASDFKESQLGMLPKRWELKPCGSVCREIVVGIVIQPTQYYRESGIPILRSANIREDGIILDDLKFMSEEDHATMKKSAVSPGDLVTIRTGYPGMTAVIPQHLPTANCVDIIISRVGDCLIPEFLALWINSDFGRGQVLQNQGGLAQQHFNVGEMKALLVAIPPVDEQTRIVDYFKSLTDEFEREKESLNKLLLLKQGLSADLLTGRVSVPPDLELP